MTTPCPAVGEIPVPAAPRCSVRCLHPTPWLTDGTTPQLSVHRKGCNFFSGTEHPPAVHRPSWKQFPTWYWAPPFRDGPPHAVPCREQAPTPCRAWRPLSECPGTRCNARQAQARCSNNGPGGQPCWGPAAPGCQALLLQAHSAVQHRSCLTCGTMLAANNHEQGQCQP